MQKSLLSNRILFAGTFLGFIVVDQLVKAWVRGALNIGGSIPKPFPGIFEIQLVHNEGIAFGQLQGKGVFMTPIALAIAGYAAWHIIRHPAETRWNHIAFGLLGSGAIGNLIDRLWLHYVTDMFSFRLINFPVFNVADACITVGTIMLFLGWGRDAVREGRQKPLNGEPTAP